MKQAVVQRATGRRNQTVAWFEPRPESLSAVRAFVVESAAVIGAGRVGAERIVSVAKELSENVIRHARTPFCVRVSRTGVLAQIEVEDRDPRVPQIESRVFGDRTTDRGLQRVEMLSRRMGVQPLGRLGKCVWAEVVLGAGSLGPPPGPARR